jgi:phage shock protein A
MKGETDAHAGFHSANAAMTQTEDHMAEATIGALANLSTATASDRGVVTALTQASARLVKQLEETSSELRELRALHHQERRDRRGQKMSTQLRTVTDGLVTTMWGGLTQSSPAPLVIMGTKRRQLELTIWEAVGQTRNDVPGRKL